MSNHSASDVILEAMDLATLTALKNWLQDEIEVKDRRFRFRTVTDSFFGKEAVDWMVNSPACPITSPKTAIRLGNMMLEANLIRSCSPNAHFRNEHTLYQFCKDPAEIKSRVASGSVKPAIKVNCWVIATGASGLQLRGQCKYRGSVEFAEGEWVGLERTDGLGHHSGSVEGRNYFDCTENTGVFVRLEQCVRDYRYEDCLVPKEYDSMKLVDLWAAIGPQFYSQPITPTDPLSPKPPNATRFVCISDTHDLHEFMKEIPDGDVLLHSGDFTMSGKPQCVSSFNEFLGKLPHPVKIVIAGNHDMTFDEETYIGKEGWKRCHHKEPYDCKSIKSLLTNCIYLEDELHIHEGIRIYGSPWQPEYNGYAFGLERGVNSRKIWNNIPDDVDILMTHGPPFGYGDETKEKEHVGCADLAQTVTRRVKPYFHVFGHVHEGYGITTNSQTVFVNAATCNFSYNKKKLNAPIVFDFVRPTQTAIPTVPPLSLSSSLGYSSSSLSELKDSEDADVVMSLSDFLETRSPHFPSTKPSSSASLPRTMSCACFYSTSGPHLPSIYEDSFSFASISTATSSPQPTSQKSSSPILETTPPTRVDISEEITRPAEISRPHVALHDFFFVCASHVRSN